jgi:hypothetical protein
MMAFRTDMDRDACSWGGAFCVEDLLIRSNLGSRNQQEQVDLGFYFLSNKFILLDYNNIGNTGT